MTARMVLALAVALHAQPPSAKRIPVRENFHGVELTDPYRWLENFEDPAAGSWIAGQDKFAAATLAKLPGQEALRRRMLELSGSERLSPPRRAGDRYFYSRTTPAAPQPIQCYRDRLDGAEKVWLDPAQAEKGMAREMYGVSRDGKLAAYAVRASGQDEIEIRFREVDTGRDLPDRLPKALYSGLSFLPDGTGVYYSTRSRETGSRIRFHRFGGNSGEIFGEGLDAKVFLSSTVDRSGRWLTIHAQRGWSGADVYVKDLKADAPARHITAGLDAQFGSIACGPGKVLLTTTWQAPRKRALLVDLERPDPSHWREVIPQASDALQYANCIGGRIYAHYAHDVQTAIRAFSPEGKALGEVALPKGAVGGISGDWEHADAFLSYETLTTPYRVDRYHTERGKTGVWFESKMAVNPADFEVTQVWYPSKDGTKIPMYLVGRKGLKPGGKGPVLLTGYGGFNNAMLPSFSAQALLWAERGAIWARPNLRGGSEFGEEWHRAGMLDKKQNVFDDFIAAAEWLIANGYTVPEKLAIAGASNGGLLVGAALTQRPELFRAVYCGYPDLDMVRYYQYTKNNNPPALFEYGDGSNRNHFPFLRSWSPYERVTEGGSYPAVLLTTGEGDTRVPPQQAVKMAAKLQWATRSKHPVLLRFYRGTGHAGGRSMHERATQTAAEYAFLMQSVGIRLD